MYRLPHILRKLIDTFMLPQLQQDFGQQLVVTLAGSTCYVPAAKNAPGALTLERFSRLGLELVGAQWWNT